MTAVRARTDAQVHARSVQVDIAGIARFLDENLGGKLTAYIAGVDSKTIKRWGREEQSPREDAERRLRAAFQVFQLLQTVEAAPTIRAWFMGMNPQLNDASPSEAIREDHHKEAMSAARAFINGG